MAPFNALILCLNFCDLGAVALPSGTNLLSLFNALASRLASNSPTVIVDEILLLATRTPEDE